MIPPFVPPEEREATPDFWRRLGEDLAKGAEAAAPHGLKVAWHNHDFEYRPLPDGSRPIDHIFAPAATMSGSRSTSPGSTAPAPTRRPSSRATPTGSSASR